ncbi:hypothetical protein ALC62_02034 [Cyphomyrmex costatus]|uniref:Uncharacterized protein n=1 Tax=Cyphomyrmex costatus TaxID=456900 RepID=A0A151INS9_9HYME|nr:hypothetical protein ALC62_02034 [Cyphomyrmex costatus]
MLLPSRSFSQVQFAVSENECRHQQERQNRPEKAQRRDARLRLTRMGELQRTLNFNRTKGPTISSAGKNRKSHFFLTKEKHKFHRSRATIVTSYHLPSPPYARRAWKQTELRFGHIGENPFDNGSWGKEHFQPSTVPWQLNPRSHGRPSRRARRNIPTVASHRKEVKKEEGKRADRREEFHGGVSSPAHQVQRCANATSPRLFHGSDGGPRPHDVDSDDEDGDEDEDDGDDVGVLPCHPCPARYGGAASVPLERLTMPGTSRPPSRARARARGTTTRVPSRIAGTSLPLRALLSYSRATHYYVNGRVASDLPPPSPRPQNPASGVNVPEFPRVSLLNMHLLRAPGRGGIGREET